MLILIAYPCVCYCIILQKSIKNRGHKKQDSLLKPFCLDQEEYNLYKNDIFWKYFTWEKKSILLISSYLGDFFPCCSHVNSNVNKKDPGRIDNK